MPLLLLLLLVSPSRNYLRPRLGLNGRMSVLSALFFLSSLCCCCPLSLSNYFSLPSPSVYVCLNVGLPLSLFLVLPFCLCLYIYRCPSLPFSVYLSLFISSPIYPFTFLSTDFSIYLCINVSLMCLLIHQRLLNLFICPVILLVCTCCL